MSYLRFLGIAIAFLLLIGCSSPKVDTSSDETMKASIEKVRNSLPEAKRKDFDDSLQLLAFSQIELKDIFTAGATGIDNLTDKMKASLNGKTGNQIIAEAEQIRKEREKQEQQQALEREEQERQQALEEIKELEEKRLNSENAREQLKKFQIIRSRFYMREQSYSRPQPIIEMTVKNGTGHAVSYGYFEGTVASLNRSVPWHKDTFAYKIPGGLEPGEEATWKLLPNMFSDWGKIDAPNDAVFTVTVKKLNDANNESIYSTDEFDKEDLERLNKLKKEYKIK
ncbi:MAG: hypothetical protein M0R76_05270 [Proteobacteria bacterium]|nr:hypothetical protein [Pseudomonadota bacterium]